MSLTIKNHGCWPILVYTMYTWSELYFFTFLLEDISYRSFAGLPPLVLATLPLHFPSLDVEVGNAREKSLRVERQESRFETQDLSERAGKPTRRK